MVIMCCCTFGIICSVGKAPLLSQRATICILLNIHSAVLHLLRKGVRFSRLSDVELKLEIAYVPSIKRPETFAGVHFWDLSNCRTSTLKGEVRSGPSHHLDIDKTCTDYPNPYSVRAIMHAILGIATAPPKIWPLRSNTDHVVRVATMVLKNTRFCTVATELAMLSTFIE